MNSCFSTLVTTDLHTDSLAVAKAFGKPHARVLVAIQDLPVPLAFGRANFRSTSYIDSWNRKQTKTTITRDGFTVLAMGFTGEKAMVWKLKFLDAFNAMEKALLKQASTLDYAAVRLQTKNVRTGLTDAVQNFVAYAVAQGSKSAPMYYANITKMEYKALDLLDKQKTSLGNFRDTLDLMDLCYLQAAELIAKGALEKGMQDKMHYKEIYLFAKQKVTAYAETLSFMRITQ
jgi:Rha family phage regulatory protein